MRFESLATAALLTLALGTPAAASAGLTEALGGMGLRFDGAPQSAVVHERRTGAWPADGSTWTVTSATGPVIVRAKAYAGVSPEDAAAREETALSRLLYLYAMDSAYPGMEAPQMPAPKDVLPRRLPSRGGAGGAAAIVSASATLTYGALLEKLVVYRGVLAFLSCAKTRRYYQVELLYPKASFDEKKALADAARLGCPP